MGRGANAHRPLRGHNRSPGKGMRANRYERSPACHSARSGRIPPHPRHSVHLPRTGVCWQLVQACRCMRRTSRVGESNTHECCQLYIYHFSCRETPGTILRILWYTSSTPRPLRFFGVLNLISASIPQRKAEAMLRKGPRCRGMSCTIC